MKVLLDKKIPYSDLFAESLKLDIDVFSDESFDISNVIEDSIVIVRSTYKTHGRDVSNNVKLLCSVSTGEDHIDKESLIAKGIPVKFSTGANAVAVKEYFLSSLAFLIKDQQFDVNGDRILIIGAGNIGSGIAKTLAEFKIDFDTFDPFVGGTINEIKNLHKYKLITAHVPLTRNGKYPTYNMLNDLIFSQVLKDTIIINTARGGILNEIEALNYQDIKFISDVFINEPNLNKDFHRHNLLATPHIAGHSQFARFKMTKMAFDHVADFLGLEAKVKESLPSQTIEFCSDRDCYDMKKYKLPVNLLLLAYDPRKNQFACEDFLNMRNEFNSRFGYDQTNIVGCSDKIMSEQLENLGFKL